MQQGSQEWIDARLGRVTASRISDVCAKTRAGAWGASRANYMAELVAERLTKRAAERFISDAMRHGTEYEPDARAAYEFYRSVTVEEIGFVPHPRMAEAGASPDGLVGADGLVEIKCPNTASHLETLLGAAIPEKYLFQMQWQLACTGRQWCDFASYDPRLPESMQLHIARVERDDALIRTLEMNVADFLAELGQTVGRLRERYDLADAA